jgi:hypothetical protein
MCSGIVDVLECGLVVPWLSGEFNFKDGIEEILLVWMFVKLLGESLESVPILEIPSGVSCN